jgi:glycosyltransferase involved in cell wall biosynthesis
VHIAIVLPRGHRYAADTPSSICTCAHDFARTNHVRSHVTTIGSACDTPFADSQFIAVQDDRGPLTLSNSLTLSKQRRYADGVLRCLARLTPDVVLVELDGWLAAHIASRYRVAPTALRLHIDAEKTMSGIKGWRRRRRLRQVDGLISVSPAMNAIIQQTMGGKPPAIAAANGIDLIYWQGLPDERREKRIVFAGRLVPEKGVLELCQALPEFLHHADRQDWQATILVTDVEKNPDLEGQCRRLLAPVADRVQWLANRSRSDVKTAMTSASIVVVPSIMIEGFGMVAAEAHAAGCAVISSGTGGLRDASRDAAVYLDAVTPDKITAALLEVSLEPALTSWRRRSITHANTHLSLEITATKIDAFLRTVIENSKRRF